MLWGLSSRKPSPLGGGSKKRSRIGSGGLERMTVDLGIMSPWEWMLPEVAYIVCAAPSCLVIM